MHNEKYVLTHEICSECVWSENGFYNAICAHCPYCKYGKTSESSYMSRGMAELLNLVNPKEGEDATCTLNRALGVEKFLK